MQDPCLEMSRRENPSRLGKGTAQDYGRKSFNSSLSSVTHMTGGSRPPLLSSPPPCLTPPFLSIPSLGVTAWEAK